MEYALVDSGVVKQVIVADADFITAHGDEVKAARGWPSGSWVSCTPGTVGIDWTYDGNVFAPPA